MPSFALYSIVDHTEPSKLFELIHQREINIEFGKRYESPGFTQMVKSDGGLHGFVITAISTSYRELISAEDGPVAQIKKSSLLAHAEFGLHNNIFYIGNPRVAAFRDYVLGTLGKNVKLERIWFSPEAFSHLDKTYVSKSHSLRQIRHPGDSTRRIRYEIDPAEESAMSQAKNLYWDPNLVEHIEVLVEHNNDFFPITFYVNGIIRLDSQKLPGGTERIVLLRQIINLSEDLYQQYPPKKIRTARISQERKRGEDASAIGLSE